LLHGTSAAVATSDYKLRETLDLVAVEAGHFEHEAVESVPRYV